MAPLSAMRASGQSARGPRLRHVLFLVVVLVVAVLLPTCVAQGGNTSTISVAPSPTPTLSGCQTCAASGDCSHAYLDGPGQFCGNWLDQLNQRQRCCCPREATCKVSNYACKCSPSRNNPSSGGDDDSRSLPASTVIGAVLGSFVAIACLVCICCACCRATAADERRPQVDVVYGTPVYAHPTSYGASYDYGYHHHHHDGGYGAGAGAAVGVSAGLLGGLLIGQAIGDGGDGGYGYDGGGDGGDGGDFGGDF